MLICSYSRLSYLLPKLRFVPSRAFGCTRCMLTHYDTLKLKSDASGKQIKEAYFKLSKECHPDLHPNDPNCHDRFIRLQEAYQVLGNSGSKKDYDATLRPHETYGRSNHSRPYGYPDFTRRDEWIKAEQQRRERKFQNEFRKDEDYYEFSQRYSQPHKLTPEEMEQFLKYKRFSSKGKELYIGFGLMFTLIIIFELLFSRKKNNYFENYSPYDNPTLTGRYRIFDVEQETKKLMNDQSYRDYLKREIKEGKVESKET